MGKHQKYALILGGSSGLGLATASKLARSGFNLYIVHRDRKSDLSQCNTLMNEFKKEGLEILLFNKDATKKETISEVLDQISLHSIDILVHSIAKGTVKDLEAMTTEDFNITIQAMALSWHTWTQALIQGKKFTSQARNVAFTSEGGRKVIANYGAVAAAKATLESLMRHMAVEYASQGLTTNCIQAGVTQTKSFSMIPGSEQIASFSIKRNPFHRLTTPEDVANVVYLLTTKEAQWINGTILKADGGEHLR